MISVCYKCKFFCEIVRYFLDSQRQYDTMSYRRNEMERMLTESEKNEMRILLVLLQESNNFYAFNAPLTTD